MRYRILTNEELSVLEDDLKAFLIVNGIDGDEWLKINQENPDKAIDLVELFSDTVLEKVYSNIHYVEYRSPLTCMLFHVLENETLLITLQLSDGSKGDFSTVESIHQTLIESSNDIHYFSQKRKHTKTKTEEVHALLSTGCTPSSKEFWNAIVTITSKK